MLLEISMTWSPKLARCACARDTLANPMTHKFRLGPAIWDEHDLPQITHARNSPHNSLTPHFQAFKKFLTLEYSWSCSAWPAWPLASPLVVIPYSFFQNLPAISIQSHNYLSSHVQTNVNTDSNQPTNSFFPHNLRRSFCLRCGYCQATGSS